MPLVFVSYEAKSFHSYTPWLEVRFIMKKSQMTLKATSFAKVLFTLTLILSVVFSFAGCGNDSTSADGVLPEDMVCCSTADAVSYIQNNSAFVFDVDYSNTDYRTTNFKITSDGTLSIVGDWNNDYGTLIGAFKPYGYDGIMIIIKMTSHTNYGHYQYPNYDEENPHSICYTAIYIKDISASSVTFASMVCHPSAETEGYTTCASSFYYLRQLFVECGYSDTCDAYSTVCTR